MIKVDIRKVKEGKNKGATKCEICLSGDMQTIIAESCTFVLKVRESIDEKDDDAASMTFKLAMVGAAFDMSFSEVRKMAGKIFDLDKDDES